MDKKIGIISTLTAVFFPLATFAFIGQPGIVNIGFATTNILYYIWVFFVAFAIIMFMVAGFLFLAGRGDPGKMKEARNAVIWGAAGIVVAILGFSITSLISGALGV